MIAFGPEVWDRMVRAVARVRERLDRTVAVLEKAGIPYAVIGGHAVAAWVGQVDESAVRNTPNVDVLVGRNDIPRMIIAMERAGFVHSPSGSFDLFLDDPSSGSRDCVRAVKAGERYRPDDAFTTAELSGIELLSEVSFRCLSLEALIRMKLTSHRRIDRVHLRDMIGVGLIDPAWPAKYPPVLAERLQALLDDPDG